MPCSIAVNTAIGLPIVASAVLLFRRNGRPDHWLLGMLTLGVMLASPLLSTQFILWLTPFVVLVRKPLLHILVGPAGGLSTLLLVWWAPDSLGWATLLVARNAVLLACAVALTTSSKVSRTATP